jgi:hypothetical protein
MSEYHFYFDKNSGHRPTSRISSEPVPASLTVNYRGEGVGVARLYANHYIAELPEEMCQQLTFGMMKHHFVTKFSPSPDPAQPRIRSFQHILVY